ncbi:MAG: hypothetical protein HYY04_14020 [Chloroflexi bacterium]|nr:hypothetical protein [Chloroflexota bacterium]
MKDELIERERSNSRESVVPAVSLTSHPQTAQILSLKDEEYHLAESIPIMVEFLADKVVVSDEQINMYGSGATLNDALRDYRASLIEYFEWLESNEQTLASHLREHLEWLRRHIRRREPV